MTSFSYFTPNNNVIHVGNKFSEWFGDMEVITSATTIYHKDLATRTPVRQVLHDYEPTEVMLGDVAKEIMKETNLLRDFRFNVFYVRDREGALRIVDVYHDGTGWCVCSRSLEDTRPCIMHRVFSGSHIN